MWGYLINQRGRNGGFRLARPAETISVAEIVRLTEEGFSTARTSSCETAIERLVDVVQRAQAAFLGVLDGYTIADIVANRDELRRVLGFEIDRAA
jgi:Rrf2 family nitric oxide-sensitive transcriptional repressor